MCIAIIRDFEHVHIELETQGGENEKVLRQSSRISFYVQMHTTRRVCISELSVVRRCNKIEVAGTCD